MEKERLVQLIKDPRAATPMDFEQLEDLIKKYPFSQTLRILLAKIAYLLDNSGKNINLKTAALYASQRGSLKKVIEQEDYPGNTFPIQPYQELPAFETFTDQDSLDSFAEEDESESSSIFREVMRNLEKLKALREQFQFLEINTEEQSELPAENLQKTEVKKEKEPVKSSDKKEAIPIKPTSPKKPIQQVITPLEEKLDIQVSEFFLSEIQKKTEPQQEYVQQASTNPQGDLIDKFIKAQPSIGSIKKEIEIKSEEVVRDLSEKSTRFGDNLISENLAIILLRQGKKDRAIEIYKKLIWKLPQKKAYFAARIEEIKK